MLWARYNASHTTPYDSATREPGHAPCNSRVSVRRSPFRWPRLEQRAGDGTGRRKDPAVVAIADAYTKASLAGDVKAIVALYTEDGVELPPNQAPVRGPAAIEAFYNEQMQSAKLTAFSLEHWESRVSGDVGYDVGAYKQTLKPADGPAVNDSGKYAVIPESDHRPLRCAAGRRRHPRR